MDMLRVIIFTALQIEYNAVRAYLIDCQEKIHLAGSIYEKGKFIASHSIKIEWDVLLVQVGSGNSEAAIEVERAINYFDPTVSLFVGIAIGIKEVCIGDVVASEKVYAYEGGVSGETFKARPDVGLPAYSLKERAKVECRKQDWLQRINFPIPTPPPKAYLVPIATGDKIIGSKNSDVYRLLQDFYNDAVAVEREGIGFFKAVCANERRVRAIMIRGIYCLVDHEPQELENDEKNIAACHASAFAFQILSTLLPPIHIDSPDPQDPPIPPIIPKRPTVYPVWLLASLSLNILAGIILLISKTFISCPTQSPSFPSPKPTQPTPQLSVPTQPKVLIVDPPPITVGGKETKLKIYVLSNNYDWKFDSLNAINYQSEDKNMEWLRKELEIPALQDSLNQMIDIIVVGTASCEGDPKDENIRARSRAVELHRTIQRVKLSNQSQRRYHKLSFGQFIDPKCITSGLDLNHSKTASQRRILIIGIEKKESSEVQVEALVIALKDLEKSGQLDFKINNYSQPSLTY